jgi:hypothetical protein
MKRDEADRYALEMLKRLEQQLSAFGATIRAGIEALEVNAADRAVDQDAGSSTTV